MDILDSVLDTVSEDMERCGYRWRCFSIEASCIGANHRRQRVWWIAEDMEYTNNTRDRTPKRGTNAHREKKDERRQKQSQSRVSRSSKTVADTRCEYREPRYAERVEENKKKRTSSAIQSKSSGEGSTTDVADTTAQGLQARNNRGNNGQRFTKPGYGSWSIEGNWESEPNVGRVANGVPNRVHRLKALGNAIVPQMAYYIGTALIKDFQYKNHNQYRSVKK